MAQQTVQPPIVREKWLPMTYEEFLELPDYLHAEWVDGEVIVFMPPDERHQDLILFLSTLLSLFARRLNLGKVIFAPFEMRIRQGRSSREPDILFVAQESRKRLARPRLEGPADLLIEVVSEYSRRRDRVEKFREYQDAGVPEYWVLDARERHEGIEFFQRTSDGTFQAVQPGPDGRYHSRAVPGFWIDPSWLWQDPLPDPLDLLALIAPEHFGGFASQRQLTPEQ